MAKLTERELAKLILEAQLNKPNSIITGSSNWAAYIAQAIKDEERRPGLSTKEKISAAGLKREADRHDKYWVDGVLYDNACRAAAALGISPSTVKYRALNPRPKYANYRVVKQSCPTLKATHNPNRSLHVN